MAARCQFGQTAFFGLAGYGYGVLTLNFGSDYGFTLLALVLAVAVAALFAAVLGYFLFFGRISGVFLGIVTLSVTLVFETLHGADRRAGMADRRTARLNGFNGMTGMPPLTIPWPGGDIVLFAGCPALLRHAGSAGRVYLGPPHPGELALRQCAGSDPGEPGTGARCWATMSASTSSPPSSSAARSRGLSGVLYTSWGQYITPSSMGLTAAALPVVWVAVGGRSDLTATLVGTLCRAQHLPDR